MKAALYVRVSTVDQLDGFSIAAQIKQLTEYCQRENIIIHKLYSDEGISGTKEDRPQFQQMLSDSQKGLFDIILVHKYDRFARNAELSQKVKKQLKKAKINLISITEPLEDSPMGFLMGGLHDLLAEYYSRNLAKESKKGHIERASQGYHNGSIPFGYISDKDKGMIIDEHRASIVREIYRKYNYEGYGSTKIAIWLNEIGIPTAVNGKWAHQPVNRILKNVKYIGKIEYDGKIYEGKHEPIISEEEFNLAQRFMTERTWQRELRGANYPKYLFVGFLKCGYCHKAMLVHVAKEKRPNRKNIDRPYYKCSRMTHADSIKKCNHRINHPVYELERNILDHIWNHDIETNNIEKSKGVQVVLIDRKNEIQKELQKILQLVIKEYITDEDYKAQRLKLEEELKIIESQPVEPNLKYEMQNKVNKLKDKFYSAKEIPEQKGILKEIIKYVYIYENDIEVYWVL